MIDRLVASVPHAQQGFRLVFSPQPFPGFAARLVWQREESGGNWYFSPTYGIEGWLCPALFKYFSETPAEIFVQASPKK